MASLWRLTLAPKITTPVISMQCLRYKCATTTLTTSIAAAVFSPKYRPFAHKSILTTTTNVRSAATAKAAAITAIGLSYGANGERLKRYNYDAGFPSYNLESKEFYSQQADNMPLLQPMLLQQLKQQQFRKFSSSPQLNTLKAPQPEKHTNMSGSVKEHKLSCRSVTKNLTLYTKNPYTSDIDPKTLEFKQPTGNPLVLIMSWLMARQRHLRKYAEIYTELGFDVIVVHITPWQLLWPAKGTQMVAVDTLNFLEYNKAYSTIIMHGFSVGAYQFGEMMLMMSRDMERYQPVLDRFICQVWDSAADITEIPTGLPKAIFPKNPRMQSALRSYTMYHMKTFYNQATVHYVRSSQMFHSTLLKVPAMFFVSDNDSVGPPSSNNSVREDWERLHIPVTFKCWNRSAHAAHFIKHRDEYLELLFKHMETSGVFETVGLKSRAKL